MKKSLLILVFVALLVMLHDQAAVAAPPGQGGGIVHYVGAGESLYGIAAQYGVSAEAIMRQNGLVNPDLIYAGQALVIPSGAYRPGPVYANPGGYGCADYYYVQEGDTLSGIAWRSGTTTETLLRLNNLHNANFVFAGQRLCVPARGYTPQPANYGNYAPAPAPRQWYQPAPAPRQASPCGCDTPNCDGCDGPAQRPERPRQSGPGGCGCDGPDCRCPSPPQPGPGSSGCDGPNSKCPPDHKPDKIEIWGDDKEYEPWGTPKDGLESCTKNDGPFDNSKPIQRLTVSFFLKNHSNYTIPSEWVDRENVIFHTLIEDVDRRACLWDPGRPLSVKPGDTILVTFYTHLLPNDAASIEFKELHKCFRIAQSDVVEIPCKKHYESLDD